MSTGKVVIEDARKIAGSFVNNQTQWLLKVDYIDNSGRTREWTSTIELFNASNPDVTIVIKDEYYNNEYIDNVFARINAIYGVKDGKMQKTKPTMVTKGKNIGKKNQTNVWTQALRDMISKYNHRVKGKLASESDKGNVHFIQPINKTADISDTKTTNVKRYPPMKAKTFARVHLKYKNKKCVEHKLIKDKDSVDISFEKTPVFAQSKYNGVHTVAHLITQSNGEVDVDMYSNKLGSYQGFDTLKKQLLYVLKESGIPQLYLDGELYKHELSLQVISGIARRHKKSSKGAADDKEKLEFHIFDCFIDSKEDSSGCSMPFIERYNILNRVLSPTVLSKAAGESKLLIKLAPTVAVANEDEMVQMMKKQVKDGYEGLMLRDGNSKYVYSFGDKRSKSLLKVKTRMDSEFKLIGYEEGKKGKEVGAIIWVLETEEGKRFTAVPKGLSYEKRYELYSSMTKEKFKKDYLGKMMTVEYEELSDDKIPLRAKAIAVRDYE